MKLLKNIFHIDHFIITVLSFVQLYVLGLIVFNIDFLNPISKALDEYSITDVFFDIEHSAGAPTTNDMITLVDMTELRDRSEIADMLNNVSMQDPICMGVDIIFEGTKQDSLGNSMLFDVVSGISSKTVFGNKLIDYDSEAEGFGKQITSFFTKNIPVKQGFCNLTDNMQGSCIREFSVKQNYAGEERVSFPVAIAQLVSDKYEVPEDENYLINYENTKFPVVKYSEIEEKSDLIEGHIVLIGTMGEEEDMHNSPLGKISGLEIQAYTLLTILNHEDLTKAPVWVNIVIGFVICFLLELMISSIELFISRHQGTVFMSFIQESNLLIVIFLFLCMAFMCWVTFYSFIRYNYILDGGLILALMALVCESRDIYHAIVVSLGTKYHWKWIENSIMNDQEV